MISKYIRLILSLSVSVITFIVYLLTLAPTVWFIDAGELAAVASTLGIAHPTGYPLFTLVGHLFSLLPISSSEIYKLNLMSSVFCTLAVFMFFYLLDLIYSYPSKDTSENKKTKKMSKHASQQKQQINSIIKYGIITASCFLLAFSKTFWGAANSVEVYPIHVFFIITLMYVFLNAVLSPVRVTDENQMSFAKNNRYYLLFALLLGLSFTNHMTTILLAPACITMFIFANRNQKGNAVKLLVFMAVCFIIGFSLYLYLPIRANQDPIFLWGNPYNFERFYWHLTGKQFSVWIFSAQGSVTVFLILLGTLLGLSIYGYQKKNSLNPNYHFAVFAAIAVISYLFLTSANEVVSKQFNTFSSSLWTEFGKGIILLAIPGVYRLSRFNIKIFYFTLLTFFGCMLYSVNYDIHDIYSYFLLSYITIAVWIGFGIYYIYELLITQLNDNYKKVAFAIVSVLIALSPLVSNYAVNDESKNYYIEEYTMNIFRNVEPNGIVISTQWDFWLSASWYYHFVKHIRPDIVVIDRELLRRSWYFTFLERNYPEIYKNSKAEIEKFLPELYKFEHGIPYDQQSIMKIFTDMTASFVNNNPGRKVYITWEIDQNKQEPVASNYLRIPEGLLFRLAKADELKNNVLPDYKVYDFTFTPTRIKDYYHETLMQSYAFMLTSSANYLINMDRIEEAKKYIELALTANPNFPQALDLKRRYNL